MLQTHHRGASRAVTTGHNQSQRVTKCPRSPSPSVPRPSQRVTNAHGASAPAPPHQSRRVTTSHGAPAPAHFARHNGSQRAPGAPAQARSARHTASQMPTGPQPQLPPPVSQQVTNARVGSLKLIPIRRPLWGLKACEILLLRRRPPL